MTHFRSLSKLTPYAGEQIDGQQLLWWLLRSVGSYRWHSQIARWLSIHLHKLVMLVCLGQLSTMASVALYCQGTFALFWGRWQRRLACVDVVPALASDVGILKQDVADIKQDVAGIKKDVTDKKDTQGLGLGSKHRSEGLQCVDIIVHQPFDN